MARTRRGDAAEPPQARLGDGTLARIVPSPYTSGYELEVDGTPQSHVDLDDPTHLHFEYIGRMAAVIDRLRMPGQPLTAVHLGAGAMTLPRYIAHTRPGSRQQVIELEQPLIDLVREHLPLPAGASIRTRIGDARTVLGNLPAGLRGQVDLLVSDVFAGAQTPAHLTSAEFYDAALALLADDGVLLVNVADGAGVALRPRTGGDRAGRAPACPRARRGAGAEGAPFREPRDRGVVVAAAHRVAAATHGGGTPPRQGGRGGRARRVRRGGARRARCGCRGIPPPVLVAVPMIAARQARGRTVLVADCQGTPAGSGPGRVRRSR